MQSHPDSPEKVVQEELHGEFSESGVMLPGYTKFHYTIWVFQKYIDKLNFKGSRCLIEVVISFINVDHKIKH